MFHRENREASTFGLTTKPASDGGWICVFTNQSTPSAATATSAAGARLRADRRGGAPSGQSQSIANASASVRASRVPMTVVLASSTRSTTVHTVLRGAAVHATHAAKPSIIPSPYGRTITAYSYAGK